MKLASREALRERYEALRVGGYGQGRALLMTRGMAIWVETWASLAPADKAPPSWGATRGRIEREVSQRPSFPTSVQADLVRVLAAIVWAVGRG